MAGVAAWRIVLPRLRRERVSVACFVVTLNAGKDTLNDDPEIARQLAHECM